MDKHYPMEVFHSQGKYFPLVYVVSEHELVSCESLSHDLIPDGLDQSRVEAFKVRSPTHPHLGGDSEGASRHVM